MKGLYPKAVANGLMPSLWRRKSRGKSQGLLHFFSMIWLRQRNHSYQICPWQCQRVRIPCSVGLRSKKILMSLRVSLTGTNGRSYIWVLNPICPSVGWGTPSWLWSQCDSAVSWAAQECYHDLRLQWQQWPVQCKGAAMTTHGAYCSVDIKRYRQAELARLVRAGDEETQNYMHAAKWPPHARIYPRLLILTSEVFSEVLCKTLKAAYRIPRLGFVCFFLFLLSIFESWKMFS